MKTSAAILTFALLTSAAGASLAEVHVHIQCKVSDGKCVPPPLPPAPPQPPTPPAPPAVPVPPALPEMPEVPEVPEAAHAACAAKSPGSSLAWTPRKGETMTGVCIRVDGKMRFSLREYERRD